MKIAIVQLLDKPCVRTRKVISGFLSAGHEVTYVGVPRTDESEPSVNYKIVLLGSKIPRGSLKKLYLQFLFFIQASKYINKCNFDMVYSVDLDGAIPVLLSKQRRNFFYDVLDTYADRYRLPTIFKSILRRLESYVARKAQVLIHVDKSRVKTLDSGERDVLIIENTPLKKDLIPLSQLRQERSYFLISGGVFVHRGLNQILEAHKKFREHFGDIELKIIGNVEPSLLAKIKSYQSVNYLGAVSSAEAQQFAMNAYTVFALYEPSSEININACPNKIYDCFFNATPVIINSELNIAKDYDEHISVLHAPYDNIEMLSLAMNEAIEVCNTKESELVKLATMYRENESWDSKFKKVLNLL
jgi:glycosyltransferase involved in cell wall biosynthesis